MNRDQFNQVAAHMLRLSGQIEWVEFPTLPLIPRGEWIRLWNRLMNDPNFKLLLARDIRKAIDDMEREHQRAAGTDDSATTAMELIIACLRSLVCRLFPSVHKLDRVPMQVKFACHAEPYTEREMATAAVG